jgi:hypothetical protein
MKPSSRPPRKPFRLSHSVHHQLHLYALAASAAGVGMLASARSAEAKVVYTKTRQVIGRNGTCNLDLNHDGTVDFIIHEWGNYGPHSLLAKEAVGNAVQGSGYAAALKPAARIGPSQRFIKSGFNGEKMVAVWYNTQSGTTYINGPWVNVKNRYLGLKFQIHGKTHYGWARLSVRVQGGEHAKTITATLTGYAYETIPKKRLRAGQTEGVADAPAVSVTTWAPGIQQTASLGALALGANGVPIWRRP